MTTPDNFAVARLMREVASEEVLPRFRNLSEDDISEKYAGELVTVADERAEAALETGLGALVPGSVVIGEELTARDPEVLDAMDNHDGPMWIVDPVDGTQNFADGKTCFAMIVAYVREDPLSHNQSLSACDPAFPHPSPLRTSFNCQTVLPPPPPPTTTTIHYLSSTTDPPIHPPSPTTAP